MVLELTAAVVAAIVLVITVCCAVGRLPRNSVVGIRVPAVMMSDTGWTAGHRAAILPTAIGAVATASLCAGSFFADGAPEWGPSAAFAAVLIPLLWGTSRAHRAARMHEAAGPATETIPADDGASDLAVPTHRTRRHALGIVVAAALAWVPGLGVITARARWADAPSRVPTHWAGSGAADGYGSSTWVFFMSAGPALMCAMIASAIVIMAATSDWTIGGAAGLGALGAVAGLVSTQWLVDSLTAVQIAAGGTGRIGTPFLMYLAGVGWGVLIFAVAAVSVRHRRPTPDAATSAPPREPDRSDGRDSAGG